MEITAKYVLKELNITRGERLTLEKLDDKILTICDTSDLNEGMEAIEVLNNCYYKYYKEEEDEIINEIIFKVISVDNKEPVYSLIEIL